MGVVVHVLTGTALILRPRPKVIYADVGVRWVAIEARLLLIAGFQVLSVFEFRGRLRHRRPVTAVETFTYKLLRMLGPKPSHVNT